MAAPRGSYQPTKGPLAGRRYELRPGDAPTAPYNRYQKDLAQARGYKSYQEQRAVTGNSVVQMLINRAVHVGGMSRTQATIEVRQWYSNQNQPAGPGGSFVFNTPYRGRSARPGAAHSRGQGMRKRAAIKWALDNGLYDTAEDAEQEIPY